jgi:hypothetical protein
MVSAPGVLRGDEVVEEERGEVVEMGQQAMVGAWEALREVGVEGEAAEGLEEVVVAEEASVR